MKSTTHLLFWIVVTAISISPATAQPSCDSLDSEEILNQTKVDDIERCLQGGGSEGEVAIDEYERTPLQGEGGSNGNVDVITMLLEDGADPNTRDENGWTALHYVAALNSNPDVITLLVEAGADLEARADDGWTALHVAAGLNDNPDVITRLIEAGADLEARDDDGWTALHFAGRFNKNPDVITRLLDLGADGTAKTDEGETVWELTVRKRAMQVSITMTYEGEAAGKPVGRVLSGSETSLIIDAHKTLFDPCDDDSEIAARNRMLHIMVNRQDPCSDENSNLPPPVDLLVPMDGPNMPDLLSRINSQHSGSEVTRLKVWT